MNPITNIILTTNILGQLRGHDIGGGICIAGAPGIGKTATMKAIAKDLNMHIIQVSLPELATEELSGLPNFVSAHHMDKYSTTGAVNSEATVWSVPQIIENANRLATEDGKAGCILFLDDLHRVNMAVAPYLYGLLGERKLGSYRLDPRVAIMGAMNDSDEAGFSGIDSPIKDRIGILPVPFDFNYWYDNFGRGLHFYISSFLKAHSTYVQEEESTMIEQFGTPRSWTHLANEFDLYDKSFIQENCLFIAKQKVSNAASAELARHIEYIEKINFVAKIKAKETINIASLKPIDQILYAYIINYCDTVEDAAYVVGLIDANITSSNFIGFLVGELHAKANARANNKVISVGVSTIVDKILGTPRDPLYYPNLSAKDKKLWDAIEFADSDKFFAIAADFIGK